MGYIFLFRMKDSNEHDRDCCAYIGDQPAPFECGHYFGGVTLHGSCYCTSNKFPKYEDIETILTEEEYDTLIQLDKAIDELKYGIEPGSDRYEKGLQLREQLMVIYDRLTSEEGQKFFEKIQESEIEFLQEHWNLSRADVEQIFDEYYLDYRDRSIVGYVYDDVYTLGYEEATQLDIVSSDANDPRNRFFDFEAFGQALVDEDDPYLELSDGRCVYLNY